VTLTVIHLDPDTAERVASGTQTVLTFPPDMANVPAAGVFVHALGFATGQRVGIARMDEQIIVCDGLTPPEFPATPLTRPGALIASAVVGAVVPTYVYSQTNQCPYRYTLHVCVMTDVVRTEARCPACWGRGKVRNPYGPGMHVNTASVSCPTCHGYGTCPPIAMPGRSDITEEEL
jgi:hypothetical protein